MAKWIMVVDDDVTNLQMAGHILSKNNMRVTALKSGRALLDYIDSKGVPDLILLDIKMPEMDGFETLKRLRALEQEKSLSETPVIFLTASEDSDTETRGFEEGVSDYVRKPFNPDVLLRRIENVVSMQSEMKSLKDEATTDKLTGLINKAATVVELSKMCSDTAGCLMMIDLDSFKLVNDIYGHEMGDKVLISFADIIRGTITEGSKAGRIGGDEFVSFCKGVATEAQVSDITKQLNEKLLASAKELMGEDMNIPLGVSVGAIMVPKYGNDYTSLLKLADKALYKVKKNGKHGYAMYSSESFKEDGTSNQTIGELSEILGERNISDVAMQLDMDAFSYVYRYVIRYVERHKTTACKLLFTLEASEGTDEQAYTDACDEFGNHVRMSLRKSDIITRNRTNQYYVFFTEFREDYVERVVTKIIDEWYGSKGHIVDITYDTEFVRHSSTGKPLSFEDKHVLMVDDDMINLKLAEKALNEGGIRVTSLTSGDALLEYIDNNEVLPDLILLDIKMPGMDGYETMSRLIGKGPDVAKIPVIFLTADESDGAEVKGLELGAMDFLRKPFVPEILRLRVNHILELVMLRKRYHR